MNYGKIPLKHHLCTMDRNFIIRWIEIAAEDIKKNKDMLTFLDTAIGDADHGINMDRGFTLAVNMLAASIDDDIGKLLKSVGMVLLSSIGGASGPLYGTFFMRAGDAIKDKTSISHDDIITLMDAGINGIIYRGKTQLGDKTMVDALVPANNVIRNSLEQGKNLEETMQNATTEAEKGMKKTIPMIAKKGRASYLGERSFGHQDPGATSAFIIVKAMLKAL